MSRAKSASRKLLIALLTDDNGVSQNAYGLLWKIYGRLHADIFNRVEVTDNRRFYLPEGWSDVER